MVLSILVYGSGFFCCNWLYSLTHSVPASVDTFPGLFFRFDFVPRGAMSTSARPSSMHSGRPRSVASDVEGEESEKGDFRGALQGFLSRIGGMRRDVKNINEQVGRLLRKEKSEQKKYQELENAMSVLRAQETEYRIMHNASSNDFDAGTSCGCDLVSLLSLSFPSVL